MCIILLAYHAHADYPLVVAANRDEFYERPTRSARFWEDAPCVLAGRDMERGGTWLGVTKSGRFAAVTNYREPLVKRVDAPSRGLLVTQFLEGDEPPDEYMSKLAERAASYNGFNLVAGTTRQLFYYSNRGSAPFELAPGVHGISNHLLDTPWPKVARGKAKLAEALANSSSDLTESIFRILSDDARAEDSLLPETGVGLELERMLSPLFITSQAYGTRSSTVVLFNRNHSVTFIERSFTPATTEREDVCYRFETVE